MRQSTGGGRGPVLLVAALLAVIGVVTIGALGPGRTASKSAARASADTSRNRSVPHGVVTSRSSTTTTTPRAPSDTTTMRLVRTITGDLSPKSVDASGHGLVTANNMIYTHKITVYDRDGNLMKTIPDTVDLASFGIAGHPGPARGGPVEGAFSPDGKQYYASNYSMYGAGFGHEGHDTCSPSQTIDPSYVYRISTSTLAIDAVIPVGKVPKYVAVTPDGRYLLVTDWCSYDLSVVSTSTLTEVRRIPIGPYPRGIAVDPQSRYAYIAVMGSNYLDRLDLADLSLTRISGVGDAPRHLVMSPDGRWLYITLNADGRVAKMDLSDDQVVARVATGQAPRSMTISPDGTALYVVNYDSGTVAKLRASDMTILQTIRTPTHPIGIAYEPTAGQVWVACYTGSILVLGDT